MTAPATAQAQQDALVQQHYRQRKALAALAVAQATQAWKQVDPRNIAGSWQALLATLLRSLMALQGQAARDGVAYAGRALEAAGVAPDPIGTVAPDSLVGVASDGRDLQTLLTTPLIGVFSDIKDGTAPDQALQAGAADLTRIVDTQITDTGRVATGLAATNDRGITGYVRIVHVPACGRCIILAGRVYSHSTGFERHPQCKCTMQILTREDWDRHVPGTDPRQLFESMTAGQQAKAFTTAGAQAIRDGADIGRVVNARRGMSTAAGPGARKLRVTSEATTRRAFGAQYGGRRRLMPEQIYLEAQRLGWGREEIVAQLKRNGFIY